MNDQQDLLRLYEQELAHLRKMGGEFARKYPKVAGRLEIGTDHCSDPYVERLIESFAFLTARIRSSVDTETRLIPEALLDILYPHYLQPVPTMSIARFAVDPAHGKLTSGYTVARHAQLFAESHQGMTCRFRTCYPVTLWPVSVAHVGFESMEGRTFPPVGAKVSWLFRIRIERQKVPLSELGMNSLRFHLNGDPALVYELYELFFAHTPRLAVVADDGAHPVLLPPGSLRAVGFDESDAVIPHPRHSHPEYRLLREYFSFPRKFLFFDVDNLDVAPAENHIDILFLLNALPKRHLPITTETFQLGCTPIVNLFPKITEPIRLNHLQSEYRLIPDVRRESSTEIHSIEKVTASTENESGSEVVDPFFSFDHQGERRTSKAYWFARRVASERKEIKGTEMHLSLVDLAFRPTLPPEQTIFAHTLCMNRHEAELLPSGAQLHIEEAAPVAAIYCLGKPTPQDDPPLGGSTYWRLISHVTVNHLTLSEGPESLKALREMLGLYKGIEETSRSHQVLGIREMTIRRVVRRIGNEAWRGFCQGTEVSLLFDEQQFVGSSAFLLAAVLDRYFALHASINSFTQLTARSLQREGIWKQWAPMAGARQLL